MNVDANWGLLGVEFGLIGLSLGCLVLDLFLPKGKRGEILASAVEEIVQQFAVKRHGRSRRRGQRLRRHHRSIRRAGNRRLVDWQVPMQGGSEQLQRRRLGDEVVDAGGAAAFDLLAVHAGFGFFDLDLVTERVRFSPAWKKLLGFTTTEMPATLETWHDLIHPDDSAGAPDRIGRKLPPGTHTFNVEFRLQHQLGHWVWVQCAGVQVVGGGCSGMSYKLGFEKDAPKPTDKQFEFENGLKILIDSKSLLFLNGTELDFSDGLNGTGFVFNNPNAKRTCGCGNSFSA